jgi:hypothetical protein
MRLRSTIQDVADLSSSDRDTMFRLMDQSYVNKRREVFDADLVAKRWVILVRRPIDDAIIGFSTQTMIEVEVSDNHITALYSGDTIIDPSEWGDPSLAHAWGNFALDLIDRHSAAQGPLYWFLTSKGFRTYHYLPLFFRLYFPCFATATSRPEQLVIDALGNRIGGDRYDTQRGIIHADSRSDFVRPQLAEISARRQSDKHVRFFIERNPYFGRGDELCCLAPLSRENFTAAAYRVIGLPPEPAQVG